MRTRNSLKRSLLQKVVIKQIKMENSILKLKVIEAMREKIGGKGAYESKKIKIRINKEQRETLDFTDPTLFPIISVTDPLTFQEGEVPKKCGPNNRLLKTAQSVTATTPSPSSCPVSTRSVKTAWKSLSTQS